MRKLIPLLLCILAACASPQKVLMRTWKIDDIVFIDTLNPYPAKEKQMLTNKLKKTVQFTFLSDSAFQVRSGDEVVNGKWWLSADKKSLFTTTGDKGLVEAKIYEVKKSLFKFETASGINQTFIFSCSPVTDKK